MTLFLYCTLQEILDQIADIDLVVNFKRTEEHSEKKNLGTGNFSPCQEYLGNSNAGCNLNLYPQNGQQVSTTSDSEGLWKEKFNIYAEQVFIQLLLNCILI